jgi:hypothetical protein
MFGIRQNCQQVCTRNQKTVSPSSAAFVIVPVQRGVARLVAQDFWL